MEKKEIDIFILKINRLADEDKELFFLTRISTEYFG